MWGEWSARCVRARHLLTPLTRTWGLVTVCVMSGAGAHLATIGHRLAPVVLVGTALLLVLETMWVVALFVDLMCRRGAYTTALRCWDAARWTCARVRAPLYACAATALLLGVRGALVTTGGAMLLVLAVLRAAPPPHAPHAADRALLAHHRPPPDPYDDDEDEEDERSRSEDPEHQVDSRPALLEI